MKKTVIRILSLGLVFAMALSVLASCSGNMKEFTGDLRERYDYNLKEYLKAGDYKGLKISTGGDIVSESELDAKILEYRVLYTATVKTWERVPEGTAAKMGDIVDVIYQGYLDGEELTDVVNYREEGYPMTLGANMLIPGVDSQLVGMKVGDKKTIEVTVPDPSFDYPYYIGEKLTIDVEITNIRAAELEPYDEPFFEYYGCTTADAFEAQVISEIKRVRANKMEDYVIARVLNSVMDTFEVKKYPEKELEEVKTSIIENDKAAAEEAGLTYEEYITSEFDVTMEQYEKDVDEYAKKFVFEEMVLYYIARNEQIALTSAALDEKATELAEENGLTTPAEYMSYMASYGYSEYSVREQIWFELVYDFIYNNTTQA